MGVMFQKEFLTRPLIAEMGKHIFSHQKDVGEDETMDVDWLAYRTLQMSDAFYFYTARINGELIGYLGYIVAFNLHYKGNKDAICDLIYVNPNHRGKMCAIKLMKFAETELSDLGVNNIGQSVKEIHDFSPMLIRQGYELEERYYTKRIQ